jgi:hypothetical protein
MTEKKAPVIVVRKSRLKDPESGQTHPAPSPGDNHRSPGGSCRA